MWGWDLIQIPKYLKQCDSHSTRSGHAHPALGTPDKWMRCTFKVRGERCGYICCSLQQRREHAVQHQWRAGKEDGQRRKFAPRPTIHGGQESLPAFFSSRVTNHIFQFNEPRQDHVPPPDGSRTKPVRGGKTGMHERLRRLKKTRNGRSKETDEAKNRVYG